MFLSLHTTWRACLLMYTKLWHLGQYFTALINEEEDISYLFLSLLFRSSSLATFQARQWLLPREANFSHMFLTFIPSNGPICLSKCVCCVLFPARFVPMPSLQWAPLSPGVRVEASRYLYRPNSWGPPSQSSEGWVEKLSWKLQVKPSVGNVSLFPLF